MILADAGANGASVGFEFGERRFTVAEHAFRIGSIKGQTGEELGGHATATAGIETAAGTAGAGVRGFTQRGEQVGRLPHGTEAAFAVDRAGLELVVQDERAGEHVADGVDEAHHAAGSAQVEPGEGLSESGEVEERIAGEDLRTGQKPVVELDLL